MDLSTYITPTEVADFIFCEKAHWLKRLGVLSLLGAARAKGSTYHHRHGEEVRAALGSAAQPADNKKLVRA